MIRRIHLGMEDSGNPSVQRFRIGAEETELSRPQMNW